jgi:tetratricopeptide (TPR) repeat protein
VCDIDCITTDTEIAGLSLALSPLIRRDLFCFKQLSVIPGEDTNVQGKPFFIGKKGLTKIGMAHGADVVIVGQLKAQGESLTVELLAYDMKTDLVVLKTSAGVEQRSSVYQLERQLVEQIISALGVQPQSDELKRLRAFHPKNYTAIVAYGFGLINEKREKYSDSLMDYENATAADEHFALAYAAEARAFNHIGAPRKAMQFYEKAVAEDEFYAEAWYRLNLYASQFAHDDNKALECCKKALEIAPRFGKARLSLGTRLHDLGHLSSAIEETKLAAAVLSKDPVPLYNLGLYYLEAGDRKAAQQWFEQALRLDPDFDRASAELKKLSSK